MIRLDAALSAIGLLVLTAASIGGATVSSSFSVYHYDSEAQNGAFKEVFIVHDSILPVATADVIILQDGEPLDVEWEDTDGRVTNGDRFWFVQEAFDSKTILTARVGGHQIMECRFGGGAGLGLTPDEWRELGHPEEIRCLEFSGD